MYALIVMGVNYHFSPDCIVCYICVKKFLLLILQKIFFRCFNQSFLKCNSYHIMYRENQNICLNFKDRLIIINDYFIYFASSYNN